MDKKRLRVALEILKAVKIEYPQTKEVIENIMDEKCQKENISADELIFHKSISKELRQKNIFCFCSEYGKQFCKNDGYEGLLQPLIMYRRTCFNTILRFRLGIFLFLMF